MEKKGKIIEKLISLMLVVGLVVCMIPATSFTTEATADGTVHVIVENTIFTPDTATNYNVEWNDSFWYGTLVDTWVTLSKDSTMMSCIGEALKTKEYTAKGVESGYISEINGLGEFDGGNKSGWMGTLNDWFTNAGFDNFSVAADDIEAGDEIRVMYTCDYGVDLGGNKAETDTSLKSLEFGVGTLDQTFDKGITDYTLTVYSDTQSVKVTPTAVNKNFQVHTYVGDTEYKRSADIPIEDGTVITVKCGAPEWPSMSGSEAATVYNIKVAKGTETTAEGQLKDVTQELEAAKAELAAVKQELAQAESERAETESQLTRAEHALAMGSSLVSSLTVTASSNSKVTGKWSAVPNAEKYKVVLYKNNKAYKTAYVEGTSTYWSGLARGYVYTMSVTPYITYKDTAYYGKAVSKKVTINLAVPTSVSAKKYNSKYYRVKASDLNSTGYVINLARNSKFTKSSKTVTVNTSGAALSKNLKTSTYFKKGTTYVRVRAYNTYNGVTVYGSWSSTVKVKR